MNGRFSTQMQGNPDEEEEGTLPPQGDADGDGVPNGGDPDPDGDGDVDQPELDEEGRPIQKGLGDADEFIAVDEDALYKGIENVVGEAISKALPTLLSEFFLGEAGQEALTKALTPVTKSLSSIRRDVQKGINTTMALGDFVDQTLVDQGEAVAKALGNVEEFKKSLTEVRENSARLAKSAARTVPAPKATTTKSDSVVSKGVGTDVIEAQLGGGDSQETVLKKAIDWTDKYNKGIPGLSDALMVAQSGGKVEKGILVGIKEFLDNNQG